MFVVQIYCVTRAPPKSARIQGIAPACRAGHSRRIGIVQLGIRGHAAERIETFSVFGAFFPPSLVRPSSSFNVMMSVLDSHPCNSCFPISDELAVCAVMSSEHGDCLFCVRGRFGKFPSLRQYARQHHQVSC